MNGFYESFLKLVGGVFVSEYIVAIGKTNDINSPLSEFEGIYTYKHK